MHVLEKKLSGEKSSKVIAVNKKLTRLIVETNYVSSLILRDTFRLSAGTAYLISAWEYGA